MPRHQPLMHDAKGALLEGAARALASARARAEFGEDAFCFRANRVGDSHVFRCSIMFRPGRPGEKPARTMMLSVR